uniref:Mitochondrial import inner membrane translocase subunit Tim17-B n=1 Tax=Spermophilus dauricus TaxID=99837 RepID=A0A8C9QKR5_SPEDA
MEEYAREPCPWRIVDDCGGAFTMGTIGGGIFQAIKGFQNSPYFHTIHFFIHVLRVMMSNSFHHLSYLHPSSFPLPPFSSV